MDQEGLRLRILRSLATMVYHLAWPIVILSALLAAGSIFVAVKKLRFTDNPNDLLKSDASYHKKYLEYTREFRPEEDYVIVVSGPQFERNRECVEFIAEKLKQQPDLFKKIFYRIDFSSLAERGLLFLDTPQLKDIDKGIKDFTKILGKDNFQLDLNSLLAVASEKFDPKYMKKWENQASVDQFLESFVNSLNLLADRLEGKTESKPIEFGNFIADNSNLREMEKEQAQHEYLSFENGKILIIQVPSPNQTATFGEHDYIIRPLKAIIQEARLQFPELRVGLTGEPALSEDESKASQKDTTVASYVTFILIAILFWLSYREFSRPSLALLTLVFAMCWTIGFTAISVGHLNILSITFVPMILGLGIDFGVQILGRYKEELPKAPDVIAAVTMSLMHTGNAILTGASTTAAAFYTMCLNDFAGLNEMGLISGTGILLCTAANLILLPALLILRDRKRTQKVGKPPSESNQSSKKHLFDRIILDHAWTIITIAALITVASLFGLRHVWFDYNLLKLQNPKLESVQFERMLIDHKGSRSVIFAASVQDNLKDAEKKAEKFKKLPTVHEVISLTEIVPRNQEEKLKIIRRIKNRLESIKFPESGVKVDVQQNIRVLQSLKKNCEHIAQLAQKWAAKKDRQEAAEFFGKLIPPMDRALKVLQPMDQAKAEQILSAYQTQVFGELRKNLEWLKKQKVDRPITEKDVPASLRDRYLSKSGKILLEIYPREDVWNREPLTHFVKDIRSVDQDVTGTPIQNYEYIELLKTSYQQAAIYALIAIIVLITLHFRTLKYVIPTLLPLALGIIWTIGIMSWFGLSFNPANIIALPLVIGIGVAFGVYAVDRYRENKSPALFSTSTGKSILLSALTTIFGFGSLALASHRGIASLGLLMTIGVTMCLITSLYICPAILHVLGRRRIEVE